MSSSPDDLARFGQPAVAQRSLRSDTPGRGLDQETFDRSPGFDVAGVRELSVPSGPSAPQINSRRVWKCDHSRVLSSVASARWAAEYFQREVAPLITPVAVDGTHPFPRLSGATISFAVDLRGTDAFGRGNLLTILRMPPSVEPLLIVPGRGSKRHGAARVCLAAMMQHCVAELFSGMTVIDCEPFRLVHDAAPKVASPTESNLPRVQLEVRETCRADIAAFLLGRMGMELGQLRRIHGCHWSKQPR